MSPRFKFQGHAYEKQYDRKRWEIPVSVIAETETQAREIVFAMFDSSRESNAYLGYSISSVEHLLEDDEPEDPEMLPDPAVLPRPVGTSRRVRPIARQR